MYQIYSSTFVSFTLFEVVAVKIEGSVVMITTAVEADCSSLHAITGARALMQQWNAGEIFRAASLTFHEYELSQYPCN